MNLINIKSVAPTKAKRMTFTETIPRLTSHVPGPKYDLTRHWDKTDPKFK